VFELPWKEQLRGCRRFRARGNLLFREGQFGRAAIQYEAALTWYEYIFPEGDEGVKEVDAERVGTLCNLAVCQLHLGKLVDAQATCEQAISMDRKCLKAWYRRAVSLRLQHKFDEAEEALKQAQSLTSDPSILRREALLLRAMRAAYKRSFAEMSARMFRPGASQAAVAAAAPTPTSPETVEAAGGAAGPDLVGGIERLDAPGAVQDPDDDAGSVTGPTTDELLRATERRE
jgi:tetratricopeptide (TPR) repeat protein